MGTRGSRGAIGAGSHLGNIVRMEQERARTLFSSADHAYLTTVGVDGAPHVVPFTFFATDETIYWAVDRKPKSGAPLQRLINISHEPRVSALADAYSPDWSALWWVRADGTAGEVTGSEAVAAIDLLAQKYPQYREARPQGPVVAISVDSWVGWSAG